ncbi:MAG: TlyA family RNA methyltransferase [Flavobacteriales bacterium]|nr:TlyA family RNA methyltransferase [Flavobacteriales bacterium]
MSDPELLIRLDQLALQRGWFETRNRAEQYIKEHGIIVAGKRVNKPGKKYTADTTLELTEEPLKWVSRAALKLEKALDHWHINPKEWVCIDVGSSTGGFTQLLLDRGAKLIYCVDTGTDQLHSTLRHDPRTVVLENTDIREAQGQITQQPDGIVVDVSFISLTRILPVLIPLAAPHTQIITLFKPQFEVGKQHVGKNGIVRDLNRVREVALNLIKNAELWSLEHHGTIDSPIKGGDGNTEFLMRWSVKTT